MEVDNLIIFADVFFSGETHTEITWKLFLISCTSHSSPFSQPILNMHVREVTDNTHSGPPGHQWVPFPYNKQFFDTAG